MVRFNSGSYLEHAKRDLVTAKLAIGQSNPNSIILSQQACEKSLKDYIVTKQDIPVTSESLRTHKVRDLRKRAGIDELSKYDVEYMDLSDYYFNGRYPGDVEIEATDENAKKYYEVALDTYTTVCKLEGKEVCPKCGYDLTSEGLCVNINCKL